MATIRSKIRILIEKSTKLHLYRILPRGVNVLFDIKILLPNSVPNIIFDVGANVGQLSKQYVEWFPRSQIYCFEPVSSTFAELQKNMMKFDNTHLFKLAFSSEKGRADICCEPSRSTLYTLNLDNISHVNASIENVDLETIDEFCHRENIPKIGLLKIDTEGHDLEILKGAEKLLSTQMIDIVQVEAGMSPKNHKFVPFEDFKLYLENKGYYLFGVYDQVHEHYTGESNLRRANPVFISSHVIELNRFEKIS
jgi:FkbM family methyltransferase